MIKKIKDEIQLSKFDVIDFLDDGETVIAFLMLAIAEGDEDCIAKCIKDVARAYDKIKNQIADLSKKVHILNEANMKLENELGKFADASKTIERLQEQLNEANEVIKKYSDGSIYLFPTWYNGSFEANKYLEKWGVK